MRRAPSDPDGDYPIIFLQGTDYVLFENGRLAKFDVEELEELNSHYSFFYDDILNIKNLKFTKKKDYSDIISKLKKPRVRLVNSFLFISLIFLFYHFSIILIDLVQDNFNFPLSWLIGFVIFFIVFFDFFIPDIIERNGNYSTITIDNSYNNYPISLRTNDKSLKDNYLDFIIGFTRFGIFITLLISGQEDNLISLIITLSTAMIVFFLPFIPFLPGEILSQYKRIKKWSKIQQLTSLEFYLKFSEIRNQILDDYRENINSKYEISIEDLLSKNESSILEYKASMWTRYKTVSKIATKEIVDIGKKDKVLEDEILHTVAAFLNTEGGTLLIGVKDKPLSWGTKLAEVFGIENDYKWLGKNNRDADGYIQAVYQVLNNGIPNLSITVKYVIVTIEQSGGKDICRIEVTPLPKIRDGELYIKERSKPDPDGEGNFYVRIGSSSHKQSVRSGSRYIRDNFPPPNFKDT